MDVEDLRLSVYRSFADIGRAPGVGDLARTFEVDDATVRHGLRSLAQARHLVLDEDDAVLMAHPFSAVPLGFAVMGERTLWWGGCAWDAFALAHLLPAQGALLVSTRCLGCSRPHAWNVDRNAPPAGDQVAHFLMPAARMWDDVVHTCRHQRICCSITCLDGWLTATGLRRGYLMDLGTHWRLARALVRRQARAGAYPARAGGRRGLLARGRTDRSLLG